LLTAKFEETGTLIPEWRISTSAQIMRIPLQLYRSIINYYCGHLIARSHSFSAFETSPSYYYSTIIFA
jgi:hypothetical protein